MTNLEFASRLTSALIAADRKESAAEVKAKRRPNVYRLGHYLHAAELTQIALETGASQTEAFVEHFTATREMHSVARQLGLAIGVQAGRWMVAAGV